MADHIEEMIENCYRREPDAKRYPGGRKNPDNLYRYRKWGYTVYRTYYGKESDEGWEMLLYSLEHQTKLALSGFGEEGVDDDDVPVDQDDVQQLRNLFTIEGLDDPLKFEGLDVEGVRDFWKAESLKMKQAVVEIPGKRRRLTTRPWETEAMADCVHDFVLLADEATLKDVANGLFVVKGVSLELFGAAGWTGGWMRIPTGYLLDLWFLLCDWPSRPENALSFSGSEEELHYWIWPGDDNRCIRTARYSEIRKFPHYEGQTYHEDLWRKRRAPPTERCHEEGSPDSSPIFYHSSDEDRPLRRMIRPETRGRKEYEAPKITDKTDIVQGTIHLTYNFGGGYDTHLEARKDPANVHLYRRWGYPIYRTYYGPGSDKSWDTLLELLQQQTMLGLEALKDKDQDDVQKLKELFYLEPHQDPAALRGLNIHELREYYGNEKRDSTRSGAMADAWSLFVLLADQSVLEDVEKGVFVVKTVCLIWTEDDDHPGFGWMRVPSRYMVELWQQLLIWKYRTDDALCFWGSEEDLHKFIWPGDGTGFCSKACPVYEKWIE